MTSTPLPPRPPLSSPPPPSEATDRIAPRGGGSAPTAAPIAPCLLELASAIDQLVERALVERRSLVRALDLLLPALCERLSARGAFVRTFGEDLEMHTFVWPKGLSSPLVDAYATQSERDARAGSGQVSSSVSELLAVHELDVAGEWFGYGGVLFDRATLDAAGAMTEAELARAVRVFCDQLDNYLHGIRTAREKHRVTMALASALQERVLPEGLAKAAEILDANVGLGRLLVVLRAEQSKEAPVHVQLFERGQRVIDTMGKASDDAASRALDADARQYLDTGDRALLDRLGIAGATEELLVFGVKNATLVGKLVAESKSGDFDTYDRELLSGFASFICQRVVDFNKEYRTLARSFRPADVDRMLREHDYADRYLEPREREVAIVFADISGFTRVCEQVLIDPSKIGKLVDVWGKAAVDAVFAHGGVFDKMVGDCVIALFGPPFYDQTPAERIAAALRSAVAIREMTRALPDRPEFAELAAHGLGVSVGVHFAPLFVGRFGPNDNFTGFSAGMNNTARLQAQAARDEILVMDEAIERIASSAEAGAFAFGPARTAAVKNVENPLAFRALVRSDG
jgi:class 3 adenylate cyclase